MIFTNIKYILNLNTTTGNQFINIINNNIYKILQEYLPTTIQLNSNYFIYCNINKNYFYITKIKHLLIAKPFQYINYIINLIIPIKIYNYKWFNYKFLLLKLPLINNQGIVLLNDVKRTLISKIFFNYGLYICYLKKEYYKIIYIYIYSQKFNIKISFYLNKNNYYITYIIIGMNKIFNFIHLMYLLNITNYMIIASSRYGNTYILNKILNCSWLQFKNITNINNYFKFNYSYIFIIINSLSNNILELFIDIQTINNILIMLLDFLLDLNLNKLFIEDNNNNFGKYILNSIVKDTTEYIKFLIKFILKNLYNKNLIIFKNYKCNYLISYKEYFLINPLLRFTEDLNILAELSINFKLDNLKFIDNSIINIYTLNLRDFKLDSIYKFCILDTSEGSNSGLILSFILNFISNLQNQFQSYLFNLKFERFYKLPKLINIVEQEFYYCSYEILSLKKELNFNKYNINTLYKNTVKHQNLNTKILQFTFDDIIGLSETLLPFNLMNDPTRCLMGAKMQTQAIPLLKSDKCLIITGNEFIIPFLYSNNIISIHEGLVKYVSSFKIIIRDILNRDIIYYLNKYQLQNSGSIFNTLPVVWIGERVSVGQLLVDNTSTLLNEFCIGNKQLVIYGSYFGYDYEDSIIISQQILYNNILSTLHLDIYEVSFNYNINIIEFSTLTIPNKSLYYLRNLDLLGIVKEGSKVIEQDIIIGKVIKEFIINTKNNLQKFLFGNNFYNISDTSLFISKGNFGRILKVEFNLNIINIKSINNYLTIRIFMGKLHMLELGDKICGRHGNKGILTTIVKPSDLPFTSTGIIPNIITGSLGVPSRLNIGQLYEGLCSIYGSFIDKRLLINTCLNNLFGLNYLKLIIYKYTYYVSNLCINKLIYNPYYLGKLKFKDGRTGNNIQGDMFLGYLQYYKLIHIIKNKINYRTTGNYTEILQQPVQGRIHNGGQRFGEMEIWALGAFGVSYTIRELFNCRSDDIKARAELSKLFINGTDTIPITSIPETFKILLKELQSLSLNINTKIYYPEISLIKNTTIYKTF